MAKENWWEKPVRMMRHDFISGYDELTRIDLDKLAKEKKEKWHINCEWMVGTIGTSTGRLPLRQKGLTDLRVLKNLTF